jgi:NAD(P)H-hydrate repair Nnr-like enzyme with NAD(P)H-hydrate epimerase domain
MTLSARLGVLAVPLAAVALLGAGCGETVIDSAKTEAAIEQNLQRATGEKVTSVECPSGVEVKAGATFGCSVVLAGGKQETATLKILNSNADVEVTGLKAAGGNK